VTIVISSTRDGASMQMIQKSYEAFHRANCAQDFSLKIEFVSVQYEELICLSLARPQKKAKFVPKLREYISTLFEAVPADETARHSLSNVGVLCKVSYTKY